MHAADTDLADVARVVERADLKNQVAVRIVFTDRNLFKHGVENGVEVADLLQLFNVVSEAGVAVKSGGVDYREVELFLGRAELIEQIKRLVHNPLRAGTRTVNLVHDHDRLQALGECLASHEAGLRHRAVDRVNEQQHTVHHGEHTLHFTAEVGVPGGIDDVDVNALPFNGAVLRENRDAAFLFDRVAVHHALFNFLVFTEGAGTLQKAVHQGRLTVVNVGNNRNIANGSCHFS